MLCHLVFAGLVSSAFGMASSPSPATAMNAVVWTPMRLRGGASEGAEGFLSRTTVGQVLAQGKDAVGKNLVVCGWAKTMRMQGSGTFAFLELNDGSTFNNIQVVVDKGIPGWDAIEANTHTHTSWHVEGVVVESPGKHKTEQETELKATAVRLLGSSPPEHYPLAKGRLPLEFLRGHPHLRMRTNTHGAVARVRSALAFAVHRFFQQHHFHYVHTPIITTSDCEGAGELFQVTTLVNDLKNNLAKQNATDPASSQNTLVDYSSDFFRKATYLTVSGQLHAEAAALALGKVYTFGPTFRAENSHTSRHLAEFWMIEPEIAFADLSDAMDCAESLLKHALAHAVQAAAADMNFFDTACQKGLGGFCKSQHAASIKKVIEEPFVRISYTEAIEILQKHYTLESAMLECKSKDAVGDNNGVEWGCDLASEHEKYLTEIHFKGPVIVYGLLRATREAMLTKADKGNADYWPKEIKAFYMRGNADNKTVAAMDILFPRAGEMAGGSQREERLGVLEERMAALGVNGAPLDWYLDLRRFGGVPHAGFGIGFDRLVQFACGLDNIRDVVFFPRAAGQATF